MSEKMKKKANNRNNMKLVHLEPDNQDPVFVFDPKCVFPDMPVLQVFEHGEALEARSRAGPEHIHRARFMPAYGGTDNVLLHREPDRVVELTRNLRHEFSVYVNPENSKKKTAVAASAPVAVPRPVLEIDEIDKAITDGMRKMGYTYKKKVGDDMVVEVEEIIDNQENYEEDEDEDDEEEDNYKDAESDMLTAASMAAEDAKKREREDELWLRIHGVTGNDLSKKRPKNAASVPDVSTPLPLATFANQTLAIAPTRALTATTITTPSPPPPPVVAEVAPVPPPQKNQALKTVHTASSPPKKPVSAKVSTSKTTTKSVSSDVAVATAPAPAPSTSRHTQKSVHKVGSSSNTTAVTQEKSSVTPEELAEFRRIYEKINAEKK